MNQSGTALPRICVLTTGLLMLASVMAQGSENVTEPAPILGSPWGTWHWLLGIAILQMVIIVVLSRILSILGGPGPHWSKPWTTGGTRTMVLVPALLALAGTAQAQAYQDPDNALSHEGTLWVLAMLNALLLGVILFQINLIRKLTHHVAGPSTELAAETAVQQGPSWWARLMQSLTRQVPVEQEKEIELDHEYDGIRELDNSLPPWWLWLFYGTIVWSVVYLVNIHVIKIWPDQDTEYRLEMAKAKADVDAYLATLTDLVDENTVERHNDPSVISTGKTIYMDNCTPCHGKALEGVEGLGPNLVDGYWKHGGGIKNVFRVIKYGVPDKGMISWKAQLKPSEIAALAEYILSKEGSNPPNAKAPEGELWQEGEATTEPKDQTSEPDTARTAAMK